MAKSTAKTVLFLCTGNYYRRLAHAAIDVEFDAGDVGGVV